MQKISVIIPAHNEEEYIEKTLDSLFKNKAQFELVIVCDSCNDKTKDIARKYTDLVFEVDFKNVAKSRNFGVSKSSGDLLVFLDADTIVSDNYLYEILKMSEVYDIGCAKWVNESNTILGKYISWLSNRYSKKNIGGNFFIKRNLFEKLKGFNEEMKRGEDSDIGERSRVLGASYIFMNKCFIIPSERRYKVGGYLNTIIKSGFRGLIYKFFRNYYNKKIASKFYD